MGKSLLIVESPTKAKTLSRYLGNEYQVKASVGHVKDLPKSQLGIEVDQGFQPTYQVIRGKNKVIKELKSAAKNADAVYLGPDPDREGEAIAWHIAEEVAGKNIPVYRVLFYELTKKAIFEALENPGELNQNLYEAQQARRILDRLVGYQISPLLWKKVTYGLSAGRVQSVTLRLICEREREIQRFVPEEYWSITASLAEAGAAEEELQPFDAKLFKCSGKKCKIGNQQEADELLAILKKQNYVVDKVQRKKRKQNPAPPFITSTLQQEAARKLGFSAKRTMASAQRLYEGVELGPKGQTGLITYMRTDSHRLSPDAVDAARGYIHEKWGNDYLPSKPVYYKTKQGAQGAHEAVRPTDVQNTPEAVAPYLGRDELKLYTLIWKRFVACQMAPAVLDQTTVDVAAGDYIFRATGSIMVFPGYTVLYEEGKDTEDAEGKESGLLPELKEGQALDLLKLLPKQHFTQPPPRFTEATIIKELEERGIGRPSTYAAIISTILQREYVQLQKKKLHPTELGFMINDLLVQHFPDIMDVEFTANMEDNLDRVEQGEYASGRLLNEFYESFRKTLEAAQENMQSLKAEGLPTGLTCPQCEQGELVIKAGKNGPFIGCARYPECSFTTNYERDEKGGVVLLNGGKTEEESTGQKCPQCGEGELVVKTGRNGPFIACNNYPKCRFTSNFERKEDGSVHLVQDPPTGETCDKCGKPMVLKRGKKGPFLACSGYPKCKNTRPLGTGIPCPEEDCQGELVERSGKRGKPFWGCSRYPACKKVFWDRPVKEECPQCGSPFLLEKTDRKTGAVKLVCPHKDCGYSRRAEDAAGEGPGEAGKAAGRSG